MRNFLILVVAASYFCPGRATTMAPYPPIDFFQCEFEITIGHPLCGIEQDTTDQFDWTRKTSDDDTFTGPEPATDHTTRINHGHYLYAPMYSLAALKNGRLNMPVFTANIVPQCLQFYYQLGNTDAGTLNVYQWLTTSPMPSTPQWTTSDDTGDVWNRGLYTIQPQSDTYAITFEGIAGYGLDAYIVLDDVSVMDGICPATNFTCTFEDGLCGFEQDKSDYGDWFRQQGSTGSLYTGPTFDHTLGTPDGFYVYLEASSLSNGREVRISTPLIQGMDDGSPEICLTFFYHMYGDSIGTLNIYVLSTSDVTRGDPVWSLTGNRGDKWRGAEVDFTLAEDFTLIFEAFKGDSYTGDIALDDIEVERGTKCPGHHAPNPNLVEGNCDFEEVELCGYTQDQTDQADWLWQSRASQESSGGPLFDHTLQNEFGFYMYIYGEVGHRLTARLVSPVVPVQSRASCLEFWWHLYGADEEKLEVYCQPEGQSEPVAPLVSYQGNHGDYWRRTRHEIPPDFTPCRVTFQGTTGIHYRDDVAIDDVAVYQGEQCPQHPSFINPTTTPPTTANIACDFDNKANPLCGWTQGLRDEFDWSIYAGPSPDPNSGPPADHTLGTDDGFYALINTYANIPSMSRAELISPLVRSASGERCFTFWYYMNGYQTAFLNVFITEYGLTMGLDPNLQLYGDRGSMWQQGQVPVPASTRSFYIMLEGTVGKYTYGADIAVDDVSLQSGACTSPTGGYFPMVANCDFEQDMCGYTQSITEYTSNSDTFDWFWNSGATGTDGTGPQADHTIGDETGHYMYLEASQPRIPGDMARLISPVMDSFNDSYCLEFFYHMSGSDTASLSVIEKGDYYPEKELARLTGPAGSGWQPYNVDVERKYGPVTIFFEGTVGNNYRGDIGLDDIKFTPGPCGGYPGTITCNFEYGIAACDFEQSSNDQLDWIWYDALVGETPPMSWPGMGSFAYTQSNGTAVQTAVLQSPILKLLNNDHCLNFMYAISNGMTLDVMSQSLSGTITPLRSFSSSTSMNFVEYTIPASTHSTEFRLLFMATTGASTDGVAIVDNVYLYFGYCGEFTGSQPVDTATTTAIVLGVLLGVAALVFVALGVLHYRNKSVASKDFPAAMTYKNGSSTDPKPDLSRDPGIDNPNYPNAPFSTA